MLEPRGHADMYGAILIAETELVQSGDAHIGVLFIHNEGYSTMCGHATIALGRFLVDTHDLRVFPRRNELRVDSDSAQVEVNIHAPCGLIRVTVPTTPNGQKSDPSRPVTFLFAPAYAVATDLRVDIPADSRWPELGSRESVTFDISYGGAFYVLVDAREIGFDGLGKINMESMARAVANLKALLETHPDVVKVLQNSVDKRLSFLYSVMLVDRTVGSRPEGVDGTETGLCFYADNQVDRSPTGSCVTARMALANSKHIREPDQQWAYNSFVSNHFNTGTFTASILEGTTRVHMINGGIKDAVTVRVQGNAFYTGAATFTVEERDVIGEKGFSIKEFAS